MANRKSPPRQPVPLVSVIIPMFNAERYIADALDSILAQTFQNFEVIVVNNCSTDSSCVVVESYMPKFGGRLTLSHMEYNTGNGGLPRNKGLSLSRGEYIFFMDADDLLTKTALEELYTLAKKYDADVVHCDRHYEADNNGTNVRIVSRQSGDLTDKPTFETEDLAERVQELLRERYWIAPWNKLSKRNLLIEHDIKFPFARISEDDIWTYGLVFYAKKYLRVPNAVYIQRRSENSVIRSKKTPQETVNFWFNPVLLALRNLDKFMSKLDFFQNNPQYRYAVLETFINGRMIFLINESFQLQPFAVYEAIKQEFGDKLGEYDVLIPALCTHINTLQKIQLINNQKFNEFAEQAQARIAELEKQLQSVRK